jgi:hypothetical protein
VTWQWQVYQSTCLYPTVDEMSRFHLWLHSKTASRRVPRFDVLQLFKKF